MNEAAENVLIVNGQAWPIPEQFSRREVMLIRRVSGVVRRKAIVRAIETGEPRACVGFVLVMMRRVDPSASLDDARRAIGVS